MSTDPTEPDGDVVAAHRRGRLGQGRPRGRGRRSRRGAGLDRFTVAHDAAGLRSLVRRLLERRRGRGRDRTARRPGRRGPARGRADGVRDRTRPAEEPARPLRVGRQQGRPVRRLRAGRRGAHRPAPAAPAAARHRGHDRAAHDRARPPGPGRPPGRGGQPAPRPPADRASPARSGCSPTSTPTSACGSWTASPPRTRPTGSRPSGWRPGCARSATAAAPTPTSCTPGCTAAPRGTTGPTADTAAAITTALVAALRTLHTQIEALADRIAEQLALHPDAPIFTSLPRSGQRPRRPAARRDRRRPRPVPHRRLTGLPGRRRALDPTVRQGQSRHLPLGRRQTTPRRPLRLRRRLPPRQPLGRRPLPTRPRPRPRPPPRRPRPRPRLGRHHLALLARPRPLRPRPNTAPSNASSTKINGGGLTQGNSCREARRTAR